jgi:hypothetical protein
VAITAGLDGMQSLRHLAGRDLFVVVFGVRVRVDGVERDAQRVPIRVLREWLERVGRGDAPAALPHDRFERRRVVVDTGGGIDPVGVAGAALAASLGAFVGEPLLVGEGEVLVGFGPDGRATEEVAVGDGS